MTHMKPLEPRIYFYRYDNWSYFDGEQVELTELVAVKKTSKGYQAISCYGDEMLSVYDKLHWVSMHSRKRYAYPTKEEALESFLARKRRQIRILSNQLTRAESAYNIASAMKLNEETK